MLKALYYASSREAETLALTFNIPGHIRIVLRYANQQLFLDDQTIIMTYSFAKDTPIPVLKALALSEDLKEVRILKEAYHLDIDTEIEDINTDQEMRFVSVLKCYHIYMFFLMGLFFCRRNDNYQKLVSKGFYDALDAENDRINQAAEDVTKHRLQAPSRQSRLHKTTIVSIADDDDVMEEREVVSRILKSTFVKPRRSSSPRKSRTHTNNKASSVSRPLFKVSQQSPENCDKSFCSSKSNSSVDVIEIFDDDDDDDNEVGDNYNPDDMDAEDYQFWHAESEVKCHLFGINTLIHKFYKFNPL